MKIGTMVLKCTLGVTCLLLSHSYEPNRILADNYKIQAAKSPDEVKYLCQRYTGFSGLAEFQDKDFVESRMVRYKNNDVPIMGNETIGKPIWITKYKNVKIPNALRGMVRDYEVAIDSTSGRLLWIYSPPLCDEGVDTLPMLPIESIDAYIKKKKIVFRETFSDTNMNFIDALSSYPGNRWNTCEMYAYFVDASTPANKDTWPQWVFLMRGINPPLPVRGPGKAQIPPEERNTILCAIDAKTGNWLYKLNIPLKYGP